MRTDARRWVCAAMVPYRLATRGTSLRELDCTLRGAMVQWPEKLGNDTGDSGFEWSFGQPATGKAFMSTQRYIGTKMERKKDVIDSPFL